MLADIPLPRPVAHPSAPPPQMSALRVLTEYLVPVLAVANDGAVVFANKAFADVLSCSCDAVTKISYEDICSFLPPDETLFAVTQPGPKSIGRVLQLGDATLFVKIRTSAIVNGAAAELITRFEGLFERLSRLSEPQGAPRQRRTADASDETKPD